MITPEDKQRFDRAFAKVPRLKCGLRKTNLYNVSIEGILVIAADDRDEAIRKGSELLQHNRSALDALSANWAERVRDTDDLVDGWHPKYVPYGLPPGDVRSIEEVLNERT